MDKFVLSTNVAFYSEIRLSAVALLVSTITIFLTVDVQSVFTNSSAVGMVLWRIFGARRDEVTGEWRRQHNEELNDLYC